MKRKQLHVPIVLMMLFFGLSVQSQTKKQTGKKQTTKTAVPKRTIVESKPIAQANDTTEKKVKPKLLSAKIAFFVMSFL